MTEYLFPSENQRDDSAYSVLVVDDDLIICRMIDALLTKSGYFVETADTLSKAMELLECKKFDLVLTDLYIRGADGLDILRKVKADDEDVPVIVFTGNPDQERIIEIFRNNADDLLIKPLGKDELDFRVARTLEKLSLKRREKEMKRLFSTFMNHLPLQIFINDEQDRLIYANRKHDEYYDSRKNLLKRLEEVFPEEIVGDLYEQNREAREKGLMDYFQTMITRDGKRRRFRTLLFPLDLGERKNLLGGIGIDMTDQILVREALKESEERLAVFIRTIPHGLMENDKNGVITLCNEGYCRLLGLEVEDVLGRNVCDFQPTEEEKKQRQALIQELNTGEKTPESFMGRILRSDGSILDVQIDWNYRRDDNGEITGYLASITDVSRLLKAEGKIHQSQALLRSIMESPRNINIWSVDRDLCYTFFNYNHKYSMKRYWGADIEIGAYLPGYITDPVYLQTTRDYYRQVLGGSHKQITDRVSDPSGKVHVFANYANPIAGEKGEITGATIFTIDITDRIEVEEQIKQSLKEKEVLLKEIHHRVKNNLQIISSILNMQTEGITDEAMKKVFLDSQNRIQAMSLIHEQLYQTEDVTGIQMEPYIQSLLATLVSSMTSGGDAVRMVSSVEPMELDIDTAIPVGLILNELVSNSIKYACGRGRAGSIELRFTVEDDMGHITVRDNGPGISETKSTVRTTSLGLILVHALADQLKGTFQMRNDNGLVSTLSFPIPSRS